MAKDLSHVLHKERKIARALTIRFDITDAIDVIIVSQNRVLNRFSKFLRVDQRVIESAYAVDKLSALEVEPGSIGRYFGGTGLVNSVLTNLNRNLSDELYKSRLSLQVGKSSSIKLITQDPSIVCGEYGVGGSCTYQVKTYTSHPKVLGDQFLHIDTIGLGDNRLKQDDKAILEIIESQVVKVSDRLKSPIVSALLLVESGADSAYRLPNVIKFLSSMFDGKIGASCVVLLTKKNQATEMFYNKRKCAIMELFEKYQIPKENLVEFMTPCEDAGVTEKDIFPNQFKALRAAIDRAKPLTTKSILRKVQMLNRRALKIQEEKTQIELHKIPSQKVNVRKINKSMPIPVSKMDGGNALLNIITFGYAGSPTITTEMVDFEYEVEVPQVQEEEIEKVLKNVPDIEYCKKLAFDEYESKIKDLVMSRKN